MGFIFWRGGGTAPAARRDRNNRGETGREAPTSRARAAPQRPPGRVSRRVRATLSCAARPGPAPHFPTVSAIPAVPRHSAPCSDHGGHVDFHPRTRPRSVRFLSTRLSPETTPRAARSTLRGGWFVGWETFDVGFIQVRG